MNYSKELLKIANMLQKIGEDQQDSEEQADSGDQQEDSNQADSNSDQQDNSDEQTDSQDNQDDSTDQQDSGEQADSQDNQDDSTDQQDSSEQTDKQDSGNNQEQFDSQLTQVITDLSTQMNNLKYDIENMKNVVMTKSQVDNADLNTTVLSNNQLMRKQAFLNIMDQLNDVADAFMHTNPHISSKIDNIMDSLRFYDKAI